MTKSIKPRMIMMVGLQGSGKSTYAKRLSKKMNAKVFSSDELRIELFGDVNEQNRNNELYYELHKRIKECLQSGNNAIYDATNVKSKSRRSFLQELKNIECIKACVIMATPYSQCVKNNNNRDRVVPEHIIKSTLLKWNTPYQFEGFDCVDVYYWGNSRNSMNIEKWLESKHSYNQYNPNHIMTLGNHCRSVGDCFNSEQELLKCAGYLHDVGKPRTRTFITANGNLDNSAHYYRHENAGAYESLFFDCGNVNPLNVSILVNLHMKPYAWEKSDNTKNQDKCHKMWGDELYNNVMKLHEADKNSH